MQKEIQYPNNNRGNGEKILPKICDVADILQIGSRNMQNGPLITACAKTQKPLMIKRHMVITKRLAWFSRICFSTR